MNTMVVLRVALMLFLLGVITKIDARLDPDAVADTPMDVITSAAGPFNADAILNSKRSNSGACCKQCECSGSNPPQCGCADITQSCRAGCRQCLCTRSLPPQRRCNDITTSCPPQCTSTSTAGP